ncbi:MAG: hypothetical protein ACR2GP_00435 [Burkholderiaceae bacterium]
MNINLRALIVGIAAAAAMTLTFDAVGASRGREIVRLEGITVTAHRDNFDADGNLKVIRLDPIVVTAHKGNE